MKVATKQIIKTPFGNITTHKSPGGTKTHTRSGLLGFFDLVQAIKNEKHKINKKIEPSKKKPSKRESKSLQSINLFNEIDSNTIKSPRTRKFLGNRTWMRSPGGLPAPVAYFNVHDGASGVEEVHKRILKVLRKALDKKPIKSKNVRNLNKNVSYNKTVSPYTPIDNNMPHRGGANHAKEIKEAEKKRQRTLSMPMSREKDFPDYALKALTDAKALRKIRGLMRGERFDPKKKMRIHPTATNWYHFSKTTPSYGYSKTLRNENMKNLGAYKRPSAAKIYERKGPMVRGKVFAIPQPPNGKRIEYKQLCLRQVKNKKQAYFAPVGTCLH
jgi:hypothetical protein